MNTDDFQRNGRQTIEYLAHYFETLRSRKVTHSVEPGYLSPIVPSDAPENGEDFKDVLEDVEKLIMPGVSGLFLIGKIVRMLNTPGTWSRPIWYLLIFYLL